ncbi:MAG TPA: hypothetical protein VIV35_02035 [Chitinophagaceae bacterium]
MRRIDLSVFIFILLSLFGCKNPEPADFLIPKEYSGRVAVVFEQKQGERPKYLNGRRIYEVPHNGILLTQFKAEFGFIDYRYFLIDENGTQTLLPIYEYEYNKDGTVRYLVGDKEKVGIFGNGTTIAYKEPGHDPTELVFNVPGLEFFVSTFNGLDTVESMEHFEQRVDSIIQNKNSR